ncbi:MAG: hypothetical protein K0V04_32775 [Deltaproteobacteria bacterium]|nr:hypothetical protein [Deltaproteobacteria bacterium]
MAQPPMGGGFMSRMTPRERTYIMAFVLTAFVMSILVLLYMRDKALSETENDITATRRALTMVYTRGAVYKERLAEKKEREAKISDKSILFSTLLEEAATVAENITPSNEEELASQELGDGLIKRSHKFNLRSVSLEDLVKFLSKIESKAGHIIITEVLSIRSPSNAEDRLNVDVTIATWERRAEEEATEGDAQDGGPS